ncbi:hydroxypyruvate isomerase family protein [Pararhodobacter zhoushanensis]|uniref:TIM barrel protein n=1 Tax=Pararhodobacter zhoushanensis TaxID=2479545 RepID=A0ABT3GZ95_9RHOB|nr:TIM barrel protein [Pararhodobacter zhoushanensis]MCW1932854.1 TIM barrel protein [Pararhodobacter zhoushanensis]
MREFSANLGFLWTDRPLPDAIRAAKAAGFAAVECHFPYDTPAAETRAALLETGLRMMTLNTRPGGTGDFGLLALKDREAEARAAIDEAFAYALATDTRAVHLMAGKHGDDATYHANLAYACDSAPPGMTLLIEAINRWHVPDYHLNTTAQAVDTLKTLNRPNLKLMFDCYHVGRTEPEVFNDVDTLRPLIGHIQIAAVPDRSAPDHGSVDYVTLLPRLNWPGPIGAEYKPNGPTDASLDWLPRLSAC